MKYIRNIDKQFPISYYTEPSTQGLTAYNHLANGIRKYYPDDHFIIDIGSGDGTLVEQLDDKYTYSVEGSTEGWNRSRQKANVCIKGDLRKSVNLPEADLTVCINVVEHVFEQFVGTLLNNICKPSDRILLIIDPYTTACNNQPLQYWVKKMESRGFKLTETGLRTYLSSKLQPSYNYMCDGMMEFKRANN